FQAEDGTRYATVTGVQTCALPICGRAGAISSGQLEPKTVSGGRQKSQPTRKSGKTGRKPGRMKPFCRNRETILKQRGSTSLAHRSEERRVGRELGMRGATSEDKHV